MSFEIGQTAAGYEFVGVQDNSRTGGAFKVKNVVADRFEVLRILPKELQADHEEVDRFLREIKVHSRLSHPNIVSFYTATEIDGKLVMTSEFFEAITLEKRLESGPMPPDEAIRCMSQVLSALSYAHELGVTHREVSPANILLGPNGTVKLTGFGLAKSANDPQLTQAGTVMGWLEYMSPEQVKGTVAIDARADIYAAGAVLYEMVAGRVPFVCKSQFEVMMAHVNTPPAPPPGAHPDLALIILTALAKDPSERFQTARQFREALEKVLAIPPALVVEALPEPPPPVEQQLGYPKLLLAGVLTFLVAAVVFFAFLKISRL